MCVYVHESWTVAIWGPLCPSFGFPLGHSNLSPSPRYTGFRDCEDTMFTERMNDAGKPSHLQGTLLKG